MTKCSYTRAPREGKIKSRDFFSGLETWRGGLQRKQTGIDQVCVAPPRPRAGRVRSARRLPRRHNLGHHVRSVLQDRDVGACRFATAGIRSRASTDRARLQRQNTPARPRMSLTATAPSPASSPPRSARACTSPSSSPARSSAKRYVTPPPVPDRTFPPRGRAAVVSHGTAWRERSIIEKKSPLADSAPRGARFADPPSSECAGREQRFRRHVGVAQQGQAVQGHDHPRAE